MTYQMKYLILYTTAKLYASHEELDDENSKSQNQSRTLSEVGNQKERHDQNTHAPKRTETFERRADEYQASAGSSC